MRKHNQGFSLIEIIIVIAILAVLTGILAPLYLRYVQRAKDSVAMTNAENFRNVINVTLIEAGSGELGEQASKDAKEFSVQYLSSTAAAPTKEDSHRVIYEIYNSFNPQGQGFEAIAIVQNYQVIQITYKDLDTNMVYVYYADKTKRYGTGLNDSTAGEWNSYQTKDGDAWVLWYSIFEDKYKKQYWNGHDPG